jgi:aspartyl-tRNA(Asn)/glutamyl-tRNA(Gln) amidotransferase subunit A
MLLYKHSACALLEMMQKKECSCLELVESLLDRIDETESYINCYITRCRESAIKSAKLIDKKRMKNERLGMLAGIPISLQDNICSKGIKTTCASKMLADFVSPYNAAAVERLLLEDSIMLGKLNLNEFGVGCPTKTDTFLPALNPYDTKFQAGGASGGCAASLAAGSCVMALGSDTGGAVRQSSAYNGVVGLKPTYGTVSRHGLVSFASSIEQIGPMARTAKDVRLLFSAICGRDYRDANSVEYSLAGHQTFKREIKELNICLPQEYSSNEYSDGLKVVMYEAAKVFEKLGASVSHVSIPSIGKALSAYHIISCCEASTNLARYDGVRYGFRSDSVDDMNSFYEKNRSEAFGSDVKLRILLGTHALCSENIGQFYHKAKAMQRQIIDEYDEVFKNFDAVLAPVISDPTPPRADEGCDYKKYFESDIFTSTASIAGLPAISVPHNFNCSNMPVGFQLVGPRYSETLLLDLAEQYEKELGIFGKVCEIKGVDVI